MDKPKPKVFISQETQNRMVAFFMKTSAPRLLAIQLEEEERKRKELEREASQQRDLDID